MARMTDILRADELKIAKDNLEAWLKLDRAAKQTAYAAAAAVGGGKRANRGFAMAFIKPFGAPDNFWYEAKILAPATTTPGSNEEAATGLITQVVTATVGFQAAALPAGPNNVANRAKKIQFAKVRCTEKSGAGVPTTSRITKLPYLKYNTNTVSTPYGVHDSGTPNSEPTAAAVIRNALMAGNPANRSVGFTSQGYVGNVTNAAPA